MTPRMARSLSLPLIIAAALAALTLACGAEGDGADRSAVGGEAALDATPQLPRDIGGAPCEDPIRAAIRPSDGIRAELGIARYDWSLSGSEVRVELVGADAAPLGTLRSEAALVLDPESGRLAEWRVESTLEREDEVHAAQLLRGRQLSGARLWLELSHRADEVELLHWVVLDDGLQAEQITLAVTTDADAEGAQRLADGRWVETFALLAEDGARRPQAEIDAWVREATGGTFEEDVDWLLLHAAGTDPDLRDAADAHVRLCRAAGVGEAESALIKSRCAGDARGDLKCSDVDRIVSGLEFVLSVNDVMGAVGTGAAVTGALVATGVVVSGPAIGAAFVAGTAGAILADRLINDAVQNNSDAIFDGLGRAGGAATGGDGEAFSDFFGGSVGDPHFDTLDGLSYDFMGAAEYLLLEAVEGAPLTVQTRQEPADGSCPGVSVNTAVVVATGAHRVAYYADLDAPVYVDGERVDVVGGAITLSDGGTVEAVGSSAQRIEMRWPSGDALRIARRATSRSAQLDVWVSLPDQRRGKVRGLLGDFDGDPDNDIRTREGRVIEGPWRWQELTWDFADSWRIDEDESLFDYFDGESHADFSFPAFPEERTRISDLPDADRAFAEETCADAGIDPEAEPAAWRGCVIDVGCTGEPVFAESHAERAGGELAELLPPIEDELATDVLESAPNRILWTFADETTDPDSHPASVVVSAIEASEGIRRFEVTDRYDYPNAPVLRFSPDTGTDSAEEAVEAGTYVTFVLEPSGEPVVLDRFRISMARGAAIGPERGLLLRWSADDFARNLWYDTVLTERPEIRRFSVPLGELVLDRAREFRLYLHTPGSSRTIEVGDMAIDLAE